MEKKNEVLRKRILPILLYCQANKGDLQLYDEWAKHKDANKNDVKQAITYLYHVNPIKINIVNVPYKGRSQRKLVRADYKKAIVTLSENEKIEVGV